MRLYPFFSCLVVLLAFPGVVVGQEPPVRELRAIEKQGVEENPVHIMIKEIYDVLQDKRATSKDIESLLPEVDWKQISLNEEKSSRHYISLGSMMRNEWVGLLFKDLRVEDSEKNLILVTGIINGRQPSACQFISHDFQHYWSLEQDRIVGFRE